MPENKTRIDQIKAVGGTAGDIYTVDANGNFVRVAAPGPGQFLGYSAGTGVAYGTPGASSTDITLAQYGLLGWF